MAITRVNQTAAPYTTSGATTTSGIDTTSGNLLVVGLVWQDNSTPPTLADSRSNTLAAAGAAVRIDVGFQAHARLYYAENAIGGAGHTFTATKASGFTSIFVAEYSGIRTSGAFDPLEYSAAGDDTTSPILSGSINTAFAESLLIGLVGDALSATGTHTANNSFASVAAINDASFWAGMLAERIVSSTGAYEFSASVTNLTSGAALIAAFKAPAGGPPPAADRLLTGPSGGLILGPSGAPLRIG